MKFVSVFFTLFLLPLISGKSVELKRRRRFLGAGPWGLFPHRMQHMTPEALFQGYDPYGTHGAIQSNLFGGTYGHGGLGFFKPQPYNPFLAKQYMQHHQAFNPFVPKAYGQGTLGFPAFKHFNPSVMAMDVPKIHSPAISMAVDFPLLKMPFGGGTPWWKGPNVCVEKHERDGRDARPDSTSSNQSISTNSRQSSECYTTETSHVCITRMKTNDIDKIYTVKRQCCHGFKRRKDGKPGCIEIDLKDLVQTMKDLGTTRFIEIITQLNFLKRLRSENFTIFTPTNEAFERYEETRKNNADRNSRSEDAVDLGTMLTSHMTDGQLRSGDLLNNMLLPPVSGHSAIRTNIYFVPDKVITANCVPLVSMNNYARNGVVHVVKRVLPIPSRTVADIIGGDPQFSILKGVLSKAGLVQMLRNPRGNFTVFAPTDSALSQDEVLLHRLQEGESCALSIIKGLILPTVVCSSAIPKHARTSNILGKYITLTRDPNDKLYLNGKQIVGRDIMGTNGVVHILDGVDIPDEAKPITELLAEKKMTEFSEFIKMAGLHSEINKMRNITLFTPSNAALQSISPAVKKQLLSNQSVLQEVILSHVGIVPLEMRNVYKDLLMKSAVDGKNIRLHRYGTFPNEGRFVTAQCAQVIGPDHHVCGGVLHVVDKMWVSPKDNVIEGLEELEGFTVLLRLLRKTGLDMTLKSSTGSFTLLAPTDDAFHQMPTTFLQKLLVDKSAARRLLMMHILPAYLCCAEVTTDVFLYHRQVRTMDNAFIAAYRTPHGVVKFGDARAVQCDLNTDNGVIHILNKVLQPAKYDFFSYPIVGPMFGGY